MWTYAYLAILVLVFLLTDLAKYKPVIVLEGFAYIATWVTYMEYLYNIYLDIYTYLHLYTISTGAAALGARGGADAADGDGVRAGHLHRGRVLHLHLRQRRG